MIKRYECDPFWDDKVFESANGPLVRYEDIEPLIQAADRISYVWAGERKTPTSDEIHALVLALANLKGEDG